MHEVVLRFLNLALVLGNDARDMVPPAPERQDGNRFAHAENLGKPGVGFMGRLRHNTAGVGCVGSVERTLLR